MPKVAKGLILVLLGLSLMSLFATPAEAQDPEGQLDSFYIQCDGLLGDTLLIKLRFKTDNTVNHGVSGLSWPILITVSNNALISLDTTVTRTFAGTMVSGFSIKSTGTDPKGGADPNLSPVHFILGAIDFGTGVFSMDSVFANIRLRLQSINSVITIDTLSGTSPTIQNFVSTNQAEGYSPAWAKDSCIFSDVQDTRHSEGAKLPTDFTLDQNFPNPFNATTVIQFALPRTSLVKLEIFNVLGQKVKTLVDEELQAGYKQVTWDGRDQRGNTVSTGVYFYRIKAADLFTDMRKMLLIK